MRLIIVTHELSKGYKLKQAILKEQPQSQITVSQDAIRVITKLEQDPPQAIFINFAQCSPEIAEAIIHKGQTLNIQLIYWHQQLNQKLIFKLLSTQIRYYYSQNYQEQELKILLDSICCKRNFISQEVLNYLTQLLLNSCIHKDLTNKEQQVLNRLQLNYSDLEIAKYLNISKSTVRTHISSINNKLKTNSRKNLILQAQSLQLI
ncbi:MAG: LuxR C-terminal-related transcriptional regulator [Waterburya sp.]